ncbi:MAG: twin-arginine translocation signal domain-containing protein [Bacteroidota bacterium]
MENIFSRRNFLKSAAISSTAAVLSGCTTASTPDGERDSFELNPNPLKLGVMTYNLAKD